MLSILGMYPQNYIHTSFGLLLINASKAPRINPPQGIIGAVNQVFKVINFKRSIKRIARESDIQLKTF